MFFVYLLEYFISCSMSVLSRTELFAIFSKAIYGLPLTLNKLVFLKCRKQLLVSVIFQAALKVLILAYTYQQSII